jgi:hypothetical protein
VLQVQPIGNGTDYNHERLERAALEHPSNTTFYKMLVSPADEAAGITRFYRWHIDAALYKLNPPEVMTLYAILVPQGPRYTCRYDDSTCDELPVPLGTTAFVSGRTTMSDIFARALQSVAVCTRVRYAPHPPPRTAWVSRSRARSKSSF